MTTGTAVSRLRRRYGVPLGRAGLGLPSATDRLPIVPTGSAMKEWNRQMNSEELVDAFREATSFYQATEAGTARRVEAFIHMLVAERMLASHSSGSTEYIAPKDPE